MKVTFGGADDLGNEFIYEGAWCRRCGALDYGEGGKPEKPRYWTVDPSSGSHRVWTRLPPCLSPGGLRAVT